jgi:hypothetical protein
MNIGIGEGVQQNSTYPEADYPDRLGPPVKFVENYTQLTGYRIKKSTVLWLYNFKSGVVERFRRRYIQ